jgi:hypothetical protein
MNTTVKPSSQRSLVSSLPGPAQREPALKI